MAGGRQLRSRREKLRNLLGQPLRINVYSEEGDILSESSFIEFREPDKGYFISGTNTQLPLSSFITKYRSYDINLRRIANFDISKAGIKKDRIYQI